MIIVYLGLKPRKIIITLCGSLNSDVPDWLKTSYPELKARIPSF
jgi:hypothetical protein